MNTKQNMIFANGRIITPDIDFYFYNKHTHKYDITFKSGITYSYNYNNVIWLKNPHVLDPRCYKIVHEGRELFGVAAIFVFEHSFQRYWHICFENNSERDYLEGDLQISTSCLTNSIVHSVLEYLRQIASMVNIRGDDGTKLLAKQYEKLNFVGNDKAFAVYTNPACYKNKRQNDNTPIFPFGCNKSQYQAVKNALDNQISIIQGPPGTGKTQTILNVITNLLIAGKTVQVVSNNNFATANIMEKLSSPEYGMGFLVATLGNSDNKAQFIHEQTGQYPEIIQAWNSGMHENLNFYHEIQGRSNALNSVFIKQEKLALAKQEIRNLQTEYKYFKQYSEETNRGNFDIKLRKKLTSKQLLQLWHECQELVLSGQSITLFFKLKSRFIYGILDWKFYRRDLAEIITVMQNLFYRVKHVELTEEIDNLEKELVRCNAIQVADEFTDMSMRYLKSILFNRYGRSITRKVFTENDLWMNPASVQSEYPIVLSTTFSSRSSLCKDAEFDYLIMDEASQVDIATGALALSCAKNAVIVGDANQLPNVLTESDKKQLQAAFDSHQISPNFNSAEKSFLQSICEGVPNAPQTLLREHYRCHPKIINFCNQKFYGGKLVIMTKDKGEKNVISAIKTVAGNHKRDRMNQRQIDVMIQEVLPSLHYPAHDIGIIAPYNNQVQAIRKALPDKQIDVSTVHKFQGREKKAIILTTVDDEVTEFSDDPYLLNVAISRAKNQLIVVASGNEQPMDSNISDLIQYIEYNNFTVTDSKVYSVFDYLYRQYTESRMDFLKKQKRVSQYESENLMHILIKDVVREFEHTPLGVVCHQPLKMLIRDPTLLGEEECRYAMNNLTHLDFTIYNLITKKPMLAIEVDGFHYHKQGTAQAERDNMKDHILKLYEIPLLRLSTNGSKEKEKIEHMLKEILS